MKATGIIHFQGRRNRIPALIVLLVPLGLVISPSWLTHSCRHESGCYASGISCPYDLLTSNTTDSNTSIQAPLVVCYHQIRDWQGSDTKNDRTYIVPPVQFEQQMKLLYNNGYRSILPGQWLDLLQQGAPLPGKTFLLTFDDGTQSQFDNALPILTRYG